MSFEFKKDQIKFVIGGSIFLIFVILSIFIIKPLFIAILSGIILAYILSPIYKFSLKYLKNKNLTALLISIIFIAAFGAGLWFGARALSDQAFSFYKHVKEANIVEKTSEYLSKVLGGDEEIATHISSTIKTGLLNIGKSITESASLFVANILTFLLQLFVAFFIMFYFIRDGDKIYESLNELLPFEEDTKRLFEKRTREVTRGVVYGRFILGLAQGIVAGIGFYIFGIPQPLLFTVLAIFFAVIPFIGAWLVWLPVGINFIITSGWQLGLPHLLFQLIITSQVDNLLAPYVVGKSAKMHNAVALVGMIGGLMSFGIIGMFIGPLILEYLFIFISLYRDTLARKKKK